MCQSLMWFLALSGISGFSHAAEYPSCIYDASDHDGDGYGYENSNTCLVDGSTISLTEPGPCIDDNADGYGWNGFSSCTVEIIQNPLCEDTDPVGDGWGWDGAQSCRVVPVVNKPESELELLKEKLLDVQPPNRIHYTIIYCPATAESYVLRTDGRLDYYVGVEEAPRGSGLWSSGMYDQDNRMIFLLNDQYKTVTSVFGETLDIHGEACVFF